MPKGILIKLVFLNWFEVIVVCLELATTTKTTATTAVGRREEALWSGFNCSVDKVIWVFHFSIINEPNVTILHKSYNTNILNTVPEMQRKK
jgi:hypothetical protein